MPCSKLEETGWFNAPMTTIFICCCSSGTYAYFATEIPLENVLITTKDALSFGGCDAVQ